MGGCFVLYHGTSRFRSAADRTAVQRYSGGRTQSMWGKYYYTGRLHSDFSGQLPIRSIDQDFYKFKLLPMTHSLTASPLITHKLLPTIKSNHLFTIKRLSSDYLRVALPYPDALFVGATAPSKCILL